MSQDLLESEARADVEMHVPQKPLFSIDEMVSITGRSKRWIERLIARGAIPTVRFGSRRMIPRAAIIAPMTTGA